MNSPPEKDTIQRYLAIDIHKHYVMIGGQNAQQEWTLRPRRIQMYRFRDWAEKNLQSGDVVVIETTGGVWDIYDIVAPLVGRTVVAHVRKVRQIAEARVKTDKEDIKRLIKLLIADIVPEVWVPPVHVRELRSLISFRWRLNKQLTMSKNRLQSVVQRYSLHPPEGGLLTDQNRDWWKEKEFSDLTGFEVEQDLEIVESLEEQKEAIDRKLAELSNTEPWASDMVFLMQIPGMGLIFSMVVLSAIGDITRFPIPRSWSATLVWHRVCTSVESGTKANRSLRKDGKSCAGPWWKPLGWRSALTPTGRDSSSDLRNVCTAIKLQWPLPAGC